MRHGAVNDDAASFADIRHQIETVRRPADLALDRVGLCFSFQESLRCFYNRINGLTLDGEARLAYMSIVKARRAGTARLSKSRRTIC
jgi:hypothetical protein